MQAAEIKDLAVGATKRVVSQFRDDDSPLNRGKEAIREADRGVRQFARAQPIMAVAIAVLAGYTLGRTIAKVS